MRRYSLSQEAQVIAKVPTFEMDAFIMDDSATESVYLANYKPIFGISVYGWLGKGRRRISLGAESC